MKITKTQLKEIIREEIQKLNEYPTIQKNLNKNAPIVVDGIKIGTSKSFTKRFKNYKEYKDWVDDNYFNNDYEVQYVYNDNRI